MRDSTTLPDLRILPTNNLVTHEECDPRRVDGIGKRIMSDGILKNPPIVAAIPQTDRFVVLDGANRVNAFIDQGIPHIVVQMVDYENSGVEVDTWYHVVSGLDIDSFEESLTQVDGMTLAATTLEKARLELRKGKALGYIVCESGVRNVLSKTNYFERRLQILVDIVGSYKGKADIFRASNDIWEIQKPYYPEITALVIFPRYGPEDIITAAKNGYKVPSGVTRHIIPNRALNINIPVSVLSSEWNIERKRQWLHEWLMERMAANAIRYYAESTFTFNE